MHASGVNWSTVNFFFKSFLSETIFREFNQDKPNPWGMWRKDNIWHHMCLLRYKSHAGYYLASSEKEGKYSYCLKRTNIVTFDLL